MSPAVQPSHLHTLPRVRITGYSYRMYVCHSQSLRDVTGQCNGSPPHPQPHLQSVDLGVWGSAPPARVRDGGCPPVLGSGRLTRPGRDHDQGSTSSAAT